MKRNCELLVLFTLILLQSCSTSFNQNLKIETKETGFLQDVDSIVIHKMNSYNIPGLAIGIVKNDSIVTCKGFGVKNIKTKNLVTPNSIFHSASISKLFTAEAIVQLIERNHLSLNDKLIDVLPELKYDDKRVEKIRLRNILNHTSGIPDLSNYHWSNNNQAIESLQNYINNLNLELEFEPETSYLYSNLGYDILGRIIEKIAKVSFEVYVKDNILNKANMHNSDFRYFKILDSLKTQPHTKSWITKNVYTRKTYPYTREHAASSTLNSSALDLSNWMMYYLKKIKNSTPNSPYLKMIEPSFDKYPYIGLSFQLSSIQQKKMIGHYGGDKGFRSYLIMIPDENMGLVLLANCDYDEDFRQEILHPIANLMLTTYLN